MLIVTSMKYDTYIAREVKQLLRLHVPEPANVPLVDEYHSLLQTSSAHVKCVARSRRGGSFCWHSEACGLEPGWRATVPVVYIIIACMSLPILIGVYMNF